MDEIGQLLEPHIPALRRYARALTRDRDLADDLVQDCLERAVGRWFLRRRDGNLRAWLFTILHNRFVSRLRAERRLGDDVEIDEETMAATAAPDDGLAVRDVLAGLDRLPTGQRAVLLLVGVEDLTYADAAAVLGIPVGTVMSRLSRGREQLRRILAQDAPVGLRRVK